MATNMTTNTQDNLLPIENPFVEEIVSDELWKKFVDRFNKNEEWSITESGLFPYKKHSKELRKSFMDIFINDKETLDFLNKNYKDMQLRYYNNDFNSISFDSLLQEFNDIIDSKSNNIEQNIYSKYFDNFRDKIFYKDRPIHTSTEYIQFITGSKELIEKLEDIKKDATNSLENIKKNKEKSNKSLDQIITNNLTIEIRELYENYLTAYRQYLLWGIAIISSIITLHLFNYTDWLFSVVCILFIAGVIHYLFLREKQKKEVDAKTQNNIKFNWCKKYLCNSIVVAVLSSFLTGGVLFIAFWLQTQEVINTINNSIADLKNIAEAIKVNDTNIKLADSILPVNFFIKIPISVLLGFLGLFLFTRSKENLELYREYRDVAVKLATLKGAISSNLEGLTQNNMKENRFYNLEEEKAKLTIDLLKQYLSKRPIAKKSKGIQLDELEKITSMYKNLQK
jgi:hypothetical protein